MMKRILSIVALVVVSSFMLTGCYSTPDPGKVIVVRNGGPFDNKAIRQIVCPGSGLTASGVNSTDHAYPTSSVQRYISVTSEANRDYADVVKVPTADGVQVGLEGTLYLTTRFDCSADGQKVLKQFDNRFGARTFPDIQGNERHPWESENGWSAFLAKSVSPVLTNDLRMAVGRFACSDMVPSCALVKQGRDGNVVVNPNVNSIANLSALEKAVNNTLEKELASTLDGDYFTTVRFKVTKVNLPDGVQNAINDAQAAYANLSQARAAVTNAELKQEAQGKLANLYAKYPALAQIELVKNLPSGANIYFGITPTLVTQAGH